MKFWDKVQFNIKFGKLSKKRNQILMRQIELGQAHPLFSLIPLYLGRFFESLSQDPNAEDDFRAFTKADENQLDFIMKMLVLWFFWSLDRLEKRILLSERLIQNGFSQIWEIDDEKLEWLIGQLDSLNPGEQLPFLWNLIFKNILKDETTTGLFSMMHLRNAQIGVLELGNP